MSVCEPIVSTDRPWDDSVDSPPDQQLVAIAHACFDFARAGDTARLQAYVENGVPANLTDATGNTLLMLAAYHGHAETVGEPPGRQRHQHAAEVDGRQEPADLRAREMQRVEQEGRERRHRQHGEGAESVRDGHQGQDRPAGHTRAYPAGRARARRRHARCSLFSTAPRNDFVRRTRHG